jgi:hypothetical protein
MTQFYVVVFQIHIVQTNNLQSFPPAAPVAVNQPPQLHSAATFHFVFIFPPKLCNND